MRMNARPILLAGVSCLLAASAAAAPIAAAQPPTPTVAAAAAAAMIPDVPYGPDARHNLDIYPGVSGARAPVVVTVPGGGWVREDNSGTAITEVSRRLVELGFVVFSPNYRVATPAVDGVPLIHQDIIRATRWVRANAAQYGGDPADINLLGGSSGAQLVTLAAELGNAQTPGLIDGVIEMSGVMNWFDFRDAGVPGTHEGAETYLGCRLDECTNSELRVPSPQLRINANSPKHLLVHGAAEALPPSQAIAMHNALVAAGISSELILVPGNGHGLRLFADPEVQAAVEAFVNS